MKVLFTLLLLFSTAPLFGDFANVRPSWSGAWYNPDQSGHGISVEFLDDERTVFFWYTYDQDGEPIWLLAQGVNSEIMLTGLFIPSIRVEATAYYYEGMIWGEFDPNTKTRQEWGTIILDFPYWDCNSAHMEWHPTMEGFTHGDTDLVRLTSLYGLDCVEPQPQFIGDWEVQFGFDAELKYQVEIVATPIPVTPDTPLLTFEFFDDTDCLWEGQINLDFIISADWGNQCGATAVEHTGAGSMRWEYKLCDSENECTRKDEVMIFEDEGEYLIFSR